MGGQEDHDMSGLAILVLGPTASGKTPLGQHLERFGLWGRRCRHFDFGAQLRAAAAGDAVARLLSAEELAVIEQSLRTGTLLEDQQFPIAARILSGFLQRIDRDDRIILNGLPRHAGQARDVAALVEVAAVISLECPPQIVCERIRCNAGGDRSGRCDDDLDAVTRKLEIYKQRTEPLIEHYHCASRPIYHLAVSMDTTPADAHRHLSTQPRPATW
jgi:adenylate kinase